LGPAARAKQHKPKRRIFMSKGNDKKKSKSTANAPSAYKSAQTPEKQGVSPFSKKPNANQPGRK
jgi:hypothetical protein